MFIWVFVWCLAGVPCTCRDSKSRVGWHTNEREAPARPICHTLCGPVCKESVSVCVQWAPGRSFLTVWNGWEGYCHRRWSWALYRQGHCWVCLQTCCQKGLGSVHRGCFPSDHVSTVSVLNDFMSRSVKSVCHKICIKPCLFFLSCGLFRSPRPVLVEPLEQFDDEDGLPEKLAQKNPRYQAWVYHF